MNTHRAFLQLVVREGNVVVLPLTPDQREKYREQDTDGVDSARLDEWLKSQGFVTLKKQ
jgi:hypothetical protein